jgi:hypothetical protein
LSAGSTDGCPVEHAFMFDFAGNGLTG